MNLVNPYKGLFPYTAEDESLFFGRDKESSDLVEMIRNNKLVVLFGESGTGKTSLIKAKLFPTLRNQYYFPIYLRINFSSATAPIKQARDIIFGDLSTWDKTVPAFDDNLSLFEYASITKIFNGLVKPILFFDQFEELFTIAPKYHKPAVIEELITQLAELIAANNVSLINSGDRIIEEKFGNLVQANDSSNAVQNAGNEIILERRNILKQQHENVMRFKVVFSLRQDFIAQLDDLRFIIPSIVTGRYRIKKFNYVQAYEAIVKPVLKITEGNPAWSAANPVITNEAALEIIRELGKGRPTLTTTEDISLMNQVIANITSSIALKENKELENLEFDPTILSLYCYQLFSDSQLVNPVIPQITLEQVKRSPFNQIIRKYYDSSLAKTKLKYDIENLLITADGRRILLPLKEFIEKSRNKHTVEEIENLWNKTAIIRIYGRGDDRELEIAHDQVAKQALISKKEREANRIKRNAAIIFLITAVIVALGIGFTLAYVNKQKSDFTVIDLREKNRKLDQSLTKINYEYADLDKTHDSTVAISQELSSKVKEMQTENYRLQYTNKVKTDTFNKLVVKLSSLQRDFASVNDQLTKKRIEANNWQAANAGLQRKNDELDKDLAGLRSENTRLKDNANSYQKRFDSVSDSLKTCEARNNPVKVDPKRPKQQQQQQQQQQTNKNKKGS